MRRLLATAILASGMAAAGAQAAEPITIRTNTAGELADTCGVNPREPGADARLNFCRGFAQGAIDVELSHAGDKDLGPAGIEGLDGPRFIIRGLDKRSIRAVTPSLYHYDVRCGMVCCQERKKRAPGRLPGALGKSQQNH